MYWIYLIFNESYRLFIKKKKVSKPNLVPKFLLYFYLILSW